MPGCRESRRSAHPHSCTGSRSRIRPKPRSPTIGSIPPTSRSAWSPPASFSTASLDSTSVRVSWNPTRTLALQASWAHLVDPEQLEPGVDQRRWSASALWAADLAPDWHAATTVAWGRKLVHGHKDDGVAAEGSLKHAGWTIFGRGEIVENRELLDIEDGPAFRVGKLSLGAVRDFPVADHLSLGAGGLFSVNFVPDALAPLYGGHNPTGVMGFVRLKLN
jgi:hypothetical protein